MQLPGAAGQVMLEDWAATTLWRSAPISASLAQGTHELPEPVWPVLKAHRDVVAAGNPAPSSPFGPGEAAAVYLEQPEPLSPPWLL